ncbi:MAG TPA: L-threonylcarbamoyladenylate synthase [Puia sp.]|jgi:L-threonylcarbamoyladenylate synthase|nr:L-threonylcarbamoyladenylate synthase [Puia sp.]
MNFGNFELFGIFTKTVALEFEKDILSCIATLKRGGIILYPTDSVWGIGADATNPAAVKKIFELKQRADGKSMIVLIADARDINKYVSRPHPYIADYLEKAKRPTTVIYDGALGLAENLMGQDGSIAIRIVKEDFCRHLIKRLKKPLVSTSANISGTPSPENFAGISEKIKSGVDYIVEFRQQDNNPAKPSQVIRFTDTGKPIILRS